MLWLLGQSLLYVALAFLLGVAVGWLIWGWALKPAKPAAGATAPAIDVEPGPADEPVAADLVIAEPVTVETTPAKPEPVVVEPEPIEPEPEPAAEPAPVVTPVTRPADNLQRLEGIGPKISKVLMAAGIKTYGQLASCDQETLNATLKQGGVRFAPNMSTWTVQAGLLAEGDEAGFAELSSQLVASRKGR